MSWDKVDPTDWQELWTAYADLFKNVWTIIVKSNKIMFWWFVNLLGKLWAWLATSFDKAEKKYKKAEKKW